MAMLPPFCEGSGPSLENLVCLPWDTAQTSAGRRAVNLKLDSLYFVYNKGDKICSFYKS